MYSASLYLNGLNFLCTQKLPKKLFYLINKNSHYQVNSIVSRSSHSPIAQSDLKPYHTNGTKHKPLNYLILSMVQPPVSQLNQLRLSRSCECNILAILARRQWAVMPSVSLPTELQFLLHMAVNLQESWLGLTETISSMNKIYINYLRYIFVLCE